MNYTVKRSGRRTIALRIEKDGSLTVLAPAFAKEADIRRAVEEHEAWIKKKSAEALERSAAHPDPTPEEEKALRLAARADLAERTAYFADIMNISYGRITITGAKTRFGSCSSEGNIAYSFRLMQYPPEARDYVVVHELCHIRHFDHSYAFWAEVANILPDYRRRRKLLKG